MVSLQVHFSIPKIRDLVFWIGSPFLKGDAGVGKTSIARRFVDDAFLTTYIHTIGIDFLEKFVEIDQQTIKLQIWDTAGQDR